MAHKRIKHTCPDIDKVIKQITTIVKEMEQIADNTESYSADLLQEQIYEWANVLEGIAEGSNCDLEALRNSNIELREWAEDMAAKAEMLENELSQID